jgi:transposase
MRGLALQVQEGLGRDPFAGDVFVFRGRSGSLIKAIWHDGIGLSCMLSGWIEDVSFGRKLSMVPFR